MSIDPHRKYDNQKENFKQDLPEDAAWLENTFTKYLRRSNAKSPYTKEKWVRWLRTILIHNSDVHASKIPEYQEDGELYDITDRIISQIQDSTYHQTEGREYSKESKDDMWYAWKKMLDSHDVSTVEGAPHMPQHPTFEQDKSKADIQADTHPQDLPSPDQMREFLKALKNVSADKVASRNQAIPLLIWDIGTRVGETLPIQMSQVRISKTKSGKRILKIDEVKGNKGADDRAVRVFQGRKFLLDYVENHPKRRDGDAYLFPKSYENDFYSPISRAEIVKKFRQAKAYADLDFKLYGEPFHIFRKAMNTYYSMNDILTWDEICSRLGKNADATKPDYLLKAMKDIDHSAAEGFGLDEASMELEHHMIAPPLFPRRCSDCGTDNYCFKEVCDDCGEILPEGDMPGRENFEEEDQEKTKMLAKIEEAMDMADKLGLDTDDISP